MQVSDITQLGVFDTETTGVDYEEVRIVTAYFGILELDGTLSRTHSWLINPGVDIPEGASNIHGISNDVAQSDGVDPVGAIGEIVDVIAGAVNAGVPIVAYNGRYDLTLLDREARRHLGYSLTSQFTAPLFAIDPFVIDKQVDKYRRGKRKLADVTAHYGVALGDDAHNAEADAVATGLVARALLGRPGVPSDLAELHLAQVVWAREQAVSLQDYFRNGGGRPDAVVEAEWPIVTYVPPAVPDESADRATEVPRAISVVSSEPLAEAERAFT